MSAALNSMRNTGRALRRSAAVVVIGTAATLAVGLPALLLPPAAMAAEKDANGKPVKPKTTVTQTLSQKTYKQMEVAQKAFEAKDYKAAEVALDGIKAGYDKLNDYEKATLWNLYAAVYRIQDKNQPAINAYLNVLKTPNLPEGLRDGALFSMAQTYFIIDDYKNAIRVMNKWLSVVSDVQPDAYILLGQAYYQLQDYKGAKEPIIKALQIAKQRNLPPKENWLGLLRAVYYELQEYPKATQVMEVLATQYPKDSYFLQLSGLYGLSGDQGRQASVMHAAYLGGYVTKSGDLVNLARLYLAQGAPQRAADLMKAKLRSGAIELNPDNLQLLAQCLSLAKETDQSIPVLQRLAGLTGESKHYLYLGQAYVEKGDWVKASEAFRNSLKGKNITNPPNINMQLGTALYNGKKLGEAKVAFQAAAESPNLADSASNWIKFINSEIERNQALSAR